MTISWYIINIEPDVQQHSSLLQIGLQLWMPGCCSTRPPACPPARLPACLVDCFNRLAFPLSVSLQQFGTGYRLRLQRRWLRLPRLLLLLLGKTQISSMSCGLGAGAGSVDWAAVLLQNRYNFVVIYSDASFQHVLQRLLHSYIKLHTHTHTGTHRHK